MLTGEFRHSLDAKGRVFLPAKWREELKEGVFVTAGLEGCLYLMTQRQFEERASQLEQFSPNQKTTRDHNRLFFSSASEEQIDKSGRMSIPAGLREHASLGKEVALIGVSGRAEIWDRAKWDHYKQEITDDYEQIAEKLDAQAS